jgi:hypothetical protein
MILSQGHQPGALPLVFEIDDRYSERGGRAHAVKDARRGLGLRLHERGVRGEADQYRFGRRGREYVLFVRTEVIGAERMTISFRIEHGNLPDDQSGLRATMSRKWMLEELVECFQAFGRLILARRSEKVEVSILANEALSEPPRDLVNALVALRKQYPDLLEELYATFEAGRSLSNNQFAALLKALKALNLRRTDKSARPAGELLPHVVIALNGPFGRMAPNFVQHAMGRAAVAFVILAVAVFWAGPSGWRMLMDVGAGQLQRTRGLDLMLELFAGAMSLAVVGTAFYTIAILIRLIWRDKVLTYIRSGK